MSELPVIDWREAAGPLASRVRPESAGKYFGGNPLRKRLLANFFRRLGGTLAAIEWQSLLDVGAGEGFVDYYIGRVFPGREVVGLEPDEEARAVAALLNPTMRYLAGDALGLPFADRSFDVVLCAEVVEHIRDYGRALSELARVARSGLLVTVPAWPYYQATNFLIGKNWRRLGEHPGHVVSFTAKKLAVEMKKATGGPVHVRMSYPWLIARAEF